MLPLASAEPGSWSFYPGPLVLLLPITIWFVYRWKQVDAHPARLLSFLLGIAVSLIALYSPIDTLGDEHFTAHMIQHLLLIDVAPILCFLGLTKTIFRPATRRLIQLERGAPWLMSPVFGLLAYSLSMWLWHVPALYDAAVRYGWVHALEHISFTVAGGLYWWHLISPVRDQRRLTGMRAPLYMASTKLLVGALGIVLTFAPTALYDVYSAPVSSWGLTPREDQQLGGAIMALEQTMIMGVALAWLVVRAFERSEREQQRKERFADQRRAAAAAKDGARELY